MNKKILFFTLLWTLPGSSLESKGPPKEQPKKRNRPFFRSVLNYQEDELPSDDETTRNEADEITLVQS
jgi:hypothetical protein